MFSKKTEGDYPSSPNKVRQDRRDSVPLTLASVSEDPANIVAKQIREKAGSTEIRLNEDSDESVENREVQPTDALLSDIEPGFKLKPLNSNPSFVHGEQIAASSEQ